MKIKRYITVGILLICCMVKVKAQLAPLGATYFQNQYLNNPAYAGLEDGLRLDLGFRQQWSSIPGAPKMQVVTADYSLTEKAGIGINFYNDEAGLFKRTRLMGSYAYHLPLNANGSKLNFGVSLGYLDELVDYSRLDGDANDLTVNNFNQRQQYIDGDFGVAYTSSTLNIQATAPNLRNTFGADKNAQQEVDEARYFFAASYKLLLPKSWDAAIEPKICYRAIKGYKDILDVGANLTLANNKVSITGFYHSSESATVGLGAKMTKNLEIMGLYTSNTAELNGQANGNFEVNLKISLFNK
jgi:type IX secretion system PorP/SprF family membrane protein